MIQVKDIAGGSYYHFGLLTGLKKLLERYQGIEQISDCIKVQINVTGLQLFKASFVQFCPILGLVMGLKTKKPFIIGLFCICYRILQRFS